MIPRFAEVPRAALALCLLVATAWPASAGSPRVTLYLHAKVITLDPRQREAEAFAVSGDRFLWTGTLAEGERRFPRARRVDLNGGVVIPGINDAHTHLYSLGQSKLRLDLKDVKTEAEAVARVKARVAVTPAGRWIRGWGWDEGAWAAHYPGNDALSAVSPRHPVYLQGLHGFAVWVNKRALEIAGITRDTPDPAKGRIVRDPATGEATGILLGAAIGLVDRHLPPPAPAEAQHAIELAAGECVRLGLTSVQEAGVTGWMLEAMRALVKRGALPLRVYAMIDARDQALLGAFLKSGPEIDASHHLTIRSIKVFADGALGSRGAVLSRPYSDRPDTSGEYSASPQDIETIARRAIAGGFQVATHAIGDRANHDVLDAYEAALEGARDRAGARFRVEHAQVLDAPDIPRFARLHVIASMQPTHATSDMPWAEDRLGPDRARGAYAWKSLVETGAHVPLSSDFPGETANPFYGIYAAVTRQDPSGSPEGGWHPRERLARDEALRGYTVEAAYAEFEEASKGTIAPGMLADFDVISQDILSVPEADILKTRVRQTYIGGTLVYRLASRPPRRRGSSHVAGPARSRRAAYVVAAAGTPRMARFTRLRMSGTL